MAVTTRSDGIFNIYENTTTTGGATVTIATLVINNHEIVLWRAELIAIESAANPRGSAHVFEFGSRWSGTNVAALVGAVTTVHTGATGSAPTITIHASGTNMLIDIVGSTDFNANWVCYVYAKKITL